MIQFEQKSIDEEFERGYEALNEFIDVEGLLELRDLIMSFKDNERYKFLGETFKDDLSEECLINSNKISFINYAKKELGSFKFLITKSNLSFTSFIGLCSVIVFSCGCDFKRDLSSSEIFEVLSSDLIPKLTLGQDNFKNIENSNLDRDFFKKLSNVKWNNQAKRLHKTIKEGCWFGIQLQHLIEPGPYSQFGFCARYLASCSVLTNDKDEVSTGDIVNAWFLTFKLFETDLCPYIFKENDKL